MSPLPDIRQLIREVPALTGLVVRGKMAGGPASDSWLGEKGGVQMVVRIDTPYAAKLGLDRQAELKVLELVSSAGIGPDIIWADPADIVHGAPLGVNQLNASSLIPGTFDYGAQTGIILNAGVHQLTVTFTPDDTVNYLTATPSVTIHVLPADPEIAWLPPDDIELGTPLGLDQLNATSIVPGNTVYNPAAGVILMPGNG